MIKHTVSKFDNNKNIERILISYFDVDKNMIYKALRKKDIKINEKRVSENITLKEGDIIEAYIFADYKSFYNIVFENDYVLIVNKRQGIPVINDKNREKCLIDLINEKLSSDYELCHRIDRNTGGLVIISKNKDFTDIIKNAINDRYYNKIYKCIVWGNASNLVGIHKAWHFKDSSKNRVFIYNAPKKHSKEIITQILSASYDKENNTTELEINLITGRTHQIRAHLAFLGHFIIGDGKYGINNVNRRFGRKYQALSACRLIPNNINSIQRFILPCNEICIEPSYE